MAHFEKELSEDKIYAGRILNFSVHHVELENGHRTIREVVHHHGGAAIAALDENGCLLMVRQYRFAVGKEMLELPAGKLEPGEDPADCAMRELEEETGYTAERLLPLARVCPVPPYCTETISVMLAEGLKKTHQHPDDGEFVTLERIPFDRALGMVLDGEILDAKTQVGILMLARKRRE